MVSTRQKALAKKNVVAQMECVPKNLMVQVSDCREFLILLLLVKGSRNSTCSQLMQVDDLFSMVMELKEGVQRSRSFGECKREIDWWSNSLPYL